MLRIEEQKATAAADPFPVLFACETPDASPAERLAWLDAHRATLLERSREVGALVFRGFGVDEPERFDAFVRAFRLPAFTYQESLSNAVRVDLTARVFTANEAPPEATIRLHHELAQTPVHPDRLFFCCALPAEQGGATSLCRSDLVLERLEEEHPDFVHTAEAEGVRYRNVMPPEDDPASAIGRSWRSTLSVDTREAADEKLGAMGYDWTWLPDGCLEATTPVLPAIRRLADGRRSFFNQMIATRSWRDARNDPERALRFGGGGTPDVSAIDRAAAIAEELAVDADWQRGDVALVDNGLVMHGRRSFVGKRRVMAAFAAAGDA